MATHWLSPLRAAPEEAELTLHPRAPDLIFPKGVREVHPTAVILEYIKPRFKESLC